MQQASRFSEANGTQSPFQLSRHTIREISAYCQTHLFLKNKKENKKALIQLATRTCCFIFISNITFTKCILRGKRRQVSSALQHLVSVYIILLLHWVSSLSFMGSENRWAGWVTKMITTWRQSHLEISMKFCFSSGPSLRAGSAWG